MKGEGEGAEPQARRQIIPDTLKERQTSTARVSRVAGVRSDVRGVREGARVSVRNTQHDWL